MENEDTTGDIIAEVESEAKNNNSQSKGDNCSSQSDLRRIDDNNILWIKAQAVNTHLVCGLCQGYLYEACTITECMHSFCKNCIVRHLQRSLNCPMCAILIHPTDPFLHIRLDGLLQDIVYALLPHVEKAEQENERLFYETHEDDRVDRDERRKNQSSSAKKRSMQQQPKTQSLHSPPSTFTTHGFGYVPPVSLCLQCLESEKDGDTVKQHNLAKQYVRVTGGATIKSLSSFLKKKLNIDESHKVDLFCPGRSGLVTLSNGHTLKAVKDLYSYNQEILQLRYDVIEQ